MVAEFFFFLSSVLLHLPAFLAALKTLFGQVFAHLGCEKQYSAGFFEVYRMLSGGKRVTVVFFFSMTMLCKWLFFDAPLLRNGNRPSSKKPKKMV